MNCLSPLENVGREFKSQSGHGCLCMRLFCVCIVLRAGSGLATGWSPVQEVLPTACRITKPNKRNCQGPTRGCRIIDDWINEEIRLCMRKYFPFTLSDIQMTGFL
jgi:hypothetical protein